MKRVQPGMVASILAGCALRLALSSVPAMASEVQGPQSGRWTLAASPYIVIGNVVVPAGKQLIIEPGVVIKVAGDFSIKVGGGLEAVGTAGNRIVFTSIRDQDFFGMLAQKTGQPTEEEWPGIIFTEESLNAKNRLEYVIIRFSRNPIAADAANPELRNITIDRCAADVMMVNRQIIAIQQGQTVDYTEIADTVPMPKIADQDAGTTQQIIPENPQTEARATLRGQIIDTETAEMLPAVNVLLIPKSRPDQQLGAATGPTGEFVMEDIQPDEYEIRVSYISYKGLRQIETLQPGEVKNITLALEYTGTLFNPITVTASRRPEAFLDTPAAIAILEKEEILARETLNPAEHLKGMPAVDVASTGLISAITAVRGFNNVFSGALLSLVDNRITRAPSLRVNSYQFIPNVSEDYDHVELVLGPGSALYGPNSANGVMHILTKSPFESPGTIVSVGGGERDILEASFRHANILNDRFAYKISGQYYQGTDWFFEDIEEARARQQALTAGADPNTLKIGARDYGVERFAGDVRLDVHINDDATLTLNAGLTQSSNIELTGIGAGQLVDWIFYYGQTRLTYKNLFVQGFVNQSDAGDTFLLRTGNPIVDKSQLLVGQMQHSYDFGQRQRFVYGLDVLLTRPHTGGTVNGAHEQNDDINEFGIYLQSETDLSSQLTFIVAGRVDEHNYIQHPVFSPRLALIFKPQSTHAFRATFNRAFSTPISNNLFLDIMQERTANPLPMPLRAALNLNDDIANVCARGVPPENGFSFRNGQNGRAQMYSQFDLADGYSDANINSVWPKIRTILTTANPQLEALLPDLLSQNVPLIYLNPATGKPIGNPVNVEPVRETVTNTFELGYKGVFTEKVTFAVDVYRTHIEDFVSPLMVISPTAHAVQAVVGPVLEEDIYNRLLATGTSDAVARATAQSVVSGIYDPNAPLNLEAVPLGVATPEQVQNDVSIIATYRNFGNVWLTGADARFSYLVNPSFTLNVNYSYVNHDNFSNLDGFADIALNAPKSKLNFGLRYQNSSNRLSGQVRVRHNAGFPVNSGTYVGDVEPYTLVDLTFMYPVIKNTDLTLTIQNILDNRHREMVGAPEIGRLAMLRLRHSF